MRQGQQNRRGRGRNGNQQRKGQNPLTRSFESTGPDVKIRGTPAHIAEKYMALARDAQSSGDPVLAENYLQHAEHYTRIIMAFREQQMGQGGDMGNGGMSRHRPGFPDPGMPDDFSDDEGDDGAADMQPVAHARGSEPQPRPFEGHRFEERPQRPPFDPGRHQHHHRERHGNEPRGFADRHQDRPDRADRPERFQRPERQDRAPGGPAEPAVEGAPQPRRPDRAGVPHHEQPEFLRRPVRRPRREENGAAADDPAPAAAVDETGHD
jgi:hypothetical protein